MIGPKRPARAQADPEGWTDLVAGAVAVLSRRRQLVEREADAADRDTPWADGHPLIDAMLGLVALGRHVDAVADMLYDDAGSADEEVEAVEDLLR